MIGHLLNRSVSILREQRTPDGAGGWETAWQMVADAVPARVSQPTTAERVVAQQSGADLTDRVYVAAGTDLRRGDELATAEGDRFRVLATVHPSVSGVYLRADCERRERRTP